MARSVPRVRGVHRIPVTVKLDPAVVDLVRQRLPETGGNLSDLLRRFVVYALVGGDEPGPMPYGWSTPDITGGEPSPVPDSPDGAWLCPHCGLMFAARVVCGGLVGDEHQMQVTVRPETYTGQSEGNGDVRAQP